MDYRALGLKVGLEIHQELETSKLFCSCPSRLEEGTVSVERYLRPVQSELGEVDRAAMMEALKDRSFVYRASPNVVCLVELDEEPPHPLNMEALEVALSVALALGASPVDEVHVMRKIVIDGSNTTGFQRTALIATDGRVELGDLKFTIRTICLEEDAARKVSEEENRVIYNLDRLGIPLIEIATGADFETPEQAARGALYIGQVLRMTGRVRRGIGTIRQDINVSVAGGARQEIKGVQRLELIPLVIEREVQRQLNLLQIRDELRRRNARVGEWRDVTEIFRESSSKLIRKVIENGGRVVAIPLLGFSGILKREIQPGRTFGRELADHAKVCGLGGLIHSDELPAYGITEREVDRVRERLQLGESDAFAILAGESQRVERAAQSVSSRALQAIEGVPEETRRALPDGNTEYMRPLPGAGRMYPETDIPPIPITKEMLERIPIPEKPEERIEKLKSRFGLSEEMATRLALSEKLELFEKLAELADPRLVATTLEETLTSLRREGLEVEKLPDEVFVEIFRKVSLGLGKEAIPELLRLCCQGMGVEEAMEKLGLRIMSVEELEEIVRKIVAEKRELIEERGERAVKPIMGLVMERVRGRIDGKIVHEVVEREVRRALGTNQLGTAGNG